MLLFYRKLVPLSPQPVVSDSFRIIPSNDSEIEATAYGLPSQNFNAEIGMKFSQLAMNEPGHIDYKRYKPSLLQIGKLRPLKSNTSKALPQTANSSSQKPGFIFNYKKNGMDKFEAKLSYILNQNWITAEIKLCPMIDQLPKLLEDSMKNVTTFETASELKKGMVIAFEAADDNWLRSLVIDVDENAKAAVIYLCDRGYFETLIPIPKKVYLIPDKVVKIPNLAVFIRIDQIMDTDLDSFYNTFLNLDEPIDYILKGNQTAEKSYKAVALAKKQPIAYVSVFDEDPNLKGFGKFLKSKTLDNP